MHPSHGSSSSERERPPRVWPLVVIVALLLMIGFWNEITGPGTSGGSREVTKIEQTMAEVTQRAEGLTVAPERTPKPSSLANSFAGMEPGRTATIEVTEENFPPTEDDVTSTTLEVAMTAEPGEVVGWVSDAQTRSLTGVEVKLQFEKAAEGEKAPALATRSDENGLFRIEAVPPGTWTAVASMKGYANAAVTGIEVTPLRVTPPLDLRLLPELVLKGSVVALGKPMTTATVTAFVDLNTVHEGGTLSTVRVVYTSATTNDKGEFELGQLPPGPLTVRAEAEGFANEELRFTIAADMKPIKIEMAPQALLSGFVRDERAVPVMEAELELRPVGNKDPKSAVSQAKPGRGGAFEFTGLPAGRSYDLFATSPRYAATGPITVVSGTSTNVVVLGTGGTISGTVTNFDTNAPVADIGIRAVLEEGATPVQLITRTNSEGRYRLRRLPAGTYTVSVANENLTAPPVAGVKVAAAAEVKDIHFAVYPGLTLEGDVRDGVTGEWLPYATVDAESRVGAGFGQAIGRKVTTDLAGLFHFENMPQGLYTLKPSLKGYTQGTGLEANPRIELLRDRLVPPVPLKLYPAGTLSGTVTSVTGGSVSNALVQVYFAGTTPGRIGGIEKFKATTDTAGRFLIEGFPLNDELHLYATAWADGYPKGQSSRIVLSRTAPYADASISLGIGVPLIVEVRDKDGSGVQDADVSFSHGAFGDDTPAGWQLKSDPMGNAVFEQVPLGRVNVSASKSGYLSAGSAAEMGTKGATTVRITLLPAIALAGRIQDDRLEPFTEGNVGAIALAGSTGGGWGGIKADGTFRIEGLGKGTFMLESNVVRNTATGQRRVTWAIPRVSPNNGMSEVVMTVPLSGRLMGNVEMTETNVKPGKFTVALKASYRDDAGRARTANFAHAFDPGTPFDFERLPPGEYNVTVTAANYLPASAGPFTVTSPGVAQAGRIVLKAGGSLKLKVEDFDTQEPVNGVLVRLSPEGPSARTNAKGEVTISPITPGIYTADFSQADYLKHTESLVHISRGKVTDLGTIPLERGAILTGVVTNTRGEPRRGAAVEVRPLDGSDVFRASSDASGRYTVRGLPSGGVTATFSQTVDERPLSRSYNPTVSSFQVTELNAILDSESDLLLGLEAPSTVDLGRALVTLYPTTRGNHPNASLPIRSTNRIGNVLKFTGLSEGTYFAAAQAPRAGGGILYWSSLISVTGTASRGNCVAGTLTLSGRVMAGKSGPPIAGQGVRLDLLSSPEAGHASFRNWWQQSRQTNNVGSFEFTHLRPGVYSFVASSEEYRSDILDIVTLSNQEPNLIVEYDFGVSPGPLGAGEKKRVPRIKVEEPAGGN